MISARIQLKTDTIENWTLNQNAVLLNGEAAVVQFPGNITKLKIGDGETPFKDLPYSSGDEKPFRCRVSEDGGGTFLSTDELMLINISEEEYENLLVNGGILSNAIYEVYSDYENLYDEQIKNLADPTDDQDAATKKYVDTEIQKIDVSEQILPLRSEISSKIYVKNGPSGEFESANLSVVNLTHDEYLKLLMDKQIKPEVVYNVSSISCLNGLGSQVVNIADPVLSDDAATKNYVDSNSSKCLMRVWTEE